MKTVRFSEDVRPITELKSKASELVDQTRQTRRPVLLTRRGRGVAVLLGVEEFETLSDRALFVEAVEVGAQAKRDGDLHDNEEAMKILDSFGE